MVQEEKTLKQFKKELNVLSILKMMELLVYQQQIEQRLIMLLAQVKAVTEDPKVGTVFDGKVTKILDFGAFVEFAPGREGLVHISQLAWERVNKVDDVLSVGDAVKIKLFEIDKQGRLNFSMKLLMDKPE